MAGLAITSTNKASKIPFLAFYFHIPRLEAKKRTPFDCCIVLAGTGRGEWERHYGRQKGSGVLHCFSCTHLPSWLYWKFKLENDNEKTEKWEKQDMKFNRHCYKLEGERLKRSESKWKWPQSSEGRWKVSWWTLVWPMGQQTSLILPWSAQRRDKFLAPIKQLNALIWKGLVKVNPLQKGAIQPSSAGFCW